MGHGRNMWPDADASPAPQQTPVTSPLAATRAPLMRGGTDRSPSAAAGPARTSAADASDAPGTLRRNPIGTSCTSRRASPRAAARPARRDLAVASARTRRSIRTRCSQTWLTSLARDASAVCRHVASAAQVAGGEATAWMQDARSRGSPQDAAATRPGTGGQIRRRSPAMAMRSRTAATNGHATPAVVASTTQTRSPSRSTPPTPAVGSAACRRSAHPPDRPRRTQRSAAVVTLTARRLAGHAGHVHPGQPVTRTRLPVAVAGQAAIVHIR